jgi:hypothetical protein
MIEILLTNGVDANTLIRCDNYNKKKWDSLEGEDVVMESALGSAIKTDKSNDLWIVQMLLRRGVNPNNIVGPKETALLAAINQNSLPLV